MNNTSIHLLPFGIDREGPINTKEYFSIENNNDQLETIMMGRKLVGKPVSLTGNTLGHVWKKSLDYNDQEDDDEETEEKSTWIKTDITVKDFTLWKKDTAPNAQDPRINAIQNWLDISQTIHEPIPLPTTNV